MLCGTNNNTRINFGRAINFLAPFASDICDILCHIALSFFRSNSSKFSNQYKLNSMSNLALSSSNKTWGNFADINSTDDYIFFPLRETSAIAAFFTSGSDKSNFFLMYSTLLR